MTENREIQLLSSQQRQIFFFLVPERACCFFKASWGHCLRESEECYKELSFAEGKMPQGLWRCCVFTPDKKESSTRLRWILTGKTVHEINSRLFLMPWSDWKGSKKLRKCVFFCTVFNEGREFHTPESIDGGSMLSLNAQWKGWNTFGMCQITWPALCEDKRCECTCFPPLWDAPC